MWPELRRWMKPNFIRNNKLKIEINLFVIKNNDLKLQKPIMDFVFNFKIKRKLLIIQSCEQKQRKRVQAAVEWPLWCSFKILFDYDSHT